MVLQRCYKNSILAVLLLGVSTTRSSTLELQLDASRTNALINPFIYGQFIEHLGRCIYGGIWAELLEDRKFSFPITADYAPYRSLTDTAFPVVGASPWQIIGEPASVTMVKEDAFVGEHSPRVQSGAGIRQRDLGVVAGKRYDGYLWAKPLGHREWPSPTAHNTPGQPRVVDIQRTDDVAVATGLRVPPLSVALFAIPLSQPR